MSNIVPFSGAPDDRARAEAERQQKIFDWAAALLDRIGVAKAVRTAATILDLRKIVLDLDCVEVALAIQNALHPATGEREAHFRGLREGNLKHILRNRFNDLKKDREFKLRQGKRADPDWAEGLILDKQNRVVPNLANVALILIHSPKWKGVLGYDQFTASITMRKPPPWGTDKSGEWTDDCESQTQIWFQQTAGINPVMGVVGRAVQRAARANSFHPVRDYLDALRWDGVPRLDTWLTTYFTMPDTEYTRAIGPRWLISGVARIFSPGVKVDHVLVLEGPQGKYKSDGLWALMPNDRWYTARLSQLGSKDSMMEVTGVWLIEIAEMDAALRARTSAMKSFISDRDDRFRPPYGIHVTRQPRQCILAATINPTGEGYIKDMTGARRLWIGKCEDTINVEAIRRDRDQLWAEAAHRYHAGEQWFLPKELEDLAQAEQEKRLTADPWEKKVRGGLGSRTDTSIQEVLVSVLQLPMHVCEEQIAQTRVARILVRLGFKRYHARLPGDDREWRYRRIPK